MENDTFEQQERADWGALHQLQQRGPNLVKPRLGGHIVRWAADEIAAARHRTLSQADGRGEALETARRLYRGLEMQAEIMRDRQRTGGWNGAENVARAFERQAEKAKELHAFLSTLTEVHQEKNDG